MIHSHPLLAFACLLVFAASLGASDLTQIDRKISKEPIYKTKAKYCLLVFGPDANKRVWLVQDGDVLYVDRNGNGDLTEASEKIASDKRDWLEEGEYSFTAGDIPEGTRLHKALSVEVSKLGRLAQQNEYYVKPLLARDPEARRYSVSIEMEMSGWKGTGVGGRVRQQTFYVDANGLLQFADRPENAPIIHFGKPSWQITLFSTQRLVIGRDTDIVLGVGTPGLGPGTTAYIDYEGVIPEKVYPTVEIRYPPKQPGGAPVREHYELKKRC